MKNTTGLEPRNHRNIYKVTKFVTFFLIFSVYFSTLQDDNRYNAGRGAHLTLKRAEKARNLVNKLPGKLLFVNQHITNVYALNRL